MPEIPEAVAPCGPGAAGQQAGTPWKHVAIALSRETGVCVRTVYDWWAGNPKRPVTAPYVYALRAATGRLGLPFRPGYGPLPPVVDKAVTPTEAMGSTTTEAA